MFNNFLNRLQQMLLQPVPMGNDLPEQGGIFGSDYGGDSGTDYGPPQSQAAQAMMTANALPNTSDYNSPSYVGDIGGPYQPNPVSDAPAPPFSEEDFYNKYMSRFNPEHAAADRYNQLISQYPMRPTHHSFGQKLAASMIGMGYGPEEGQKFLDSDYNDQVADWKNQVGPAMNSANLERYMNVNERQLLSQEARNASLEEKNKITEKDVDSKVAHRQALDESRTFLQNHPDWKPLKEKGGTIKLYNSKDPTQVIDTKVPSGTVDDLTFENLKAEHAMERTLTTTQGSMDRTAEAGHTILGRTGDDNKEHYYVVDKDGNVLKEVQIPGSGVVAKPGSASLGSGGTGDKPLSPTQLKQLRTNRANEIINSGDPDAKSYIKFEQDGPHIIPPSDSVWAAADPAVKAKVMKWRDYIEAPEGSKNPAGGGSPNPAAKGGTTHMVGPDGKGYNVPNEKLDLFKQNGYKVG